MKKDKITPREKEVSEYIKEGLNNTEIGKILGVSKHTIKAHTIHLLKKMNAKNRIHLAYILGCEQGTKNNSNL